MSLTDKVIKNTFYHLLSQIIGFLFPFILTPIIISKIGAVEFGLYAIAMGFIGTFGLFDLSISSSFIKFISEHYNKKECNELNDTIGTGFIFYLIFSLVVCVIGYIFSNQFVALIKVPSNLIAVGIFTLHISLLIFFIANSTTIFLSILISLQKMYINSLVGIAISFLNFISIYFLLTLGYGLKGLLYSQLLTTIISGAFTVFLAKKNLPEMSLGFKNLNLHSLKKMSSFGIQMQTSKVASFASEKYDELLLAYFSVLSNVTYFNLGSRVSRLGRFLPFQLIPQVAPIAAELNAKEEKEKINQLYDDATKYLTIISVPIFIFLFVFADTIIFTWMGSHDYYISVHILRILTLGQLVNLIFSAPGNSITPNLGVPKFQMYEGIISLIINLLLSYILIKNFGILGAAAGNTTATIISSTYILIVSTKFFGKNIFLLFIEKYLTPLIAGGVSIVITLICSYLTNNYIFKIGGRSSGIASLGINGAVFLFIYFFWLLNSNYTKQRDNIVLAKIITKVLPLELFLRPFPIDYKSKQYDNELVSLIIVTHNRLDFLKKNLTSLLPTLENINYELFVWDNNSQDGTAQFLRQLQHNQRIKIILHNQNIGTNAKGKAIELTKGDFIIGLDDDVIEFPENWLQEMIYAYKNIPYIGYLSSDVIQDETTDGAKHPDQAYSELEYDNSNIKLLVGPTGGWCFMISREVYNKVGKFHQSPKRIFFNEDMDYTNRTINKGLKVGILKGIKVYHATGHFHNKNYMQVFNQKMKDHYMGNSFWYEFKLKVKTLLSLKRYVTKTIELANK